MALESIKRVDELDVSLEQYPTPASIAAAILYSAEMENHDITDKTVCDLGCGDGIFAIGAALLGAMRVIGVDVQSKSLKVSQQNARMLSVEGTTDWILGDVSSLEMRRRVDTVVTNPPFGVKTRGADLKFLRKALSIAGVTYSIHLAGNKNRAFLKQTIEGLGGNLTQVETFQFPIRRLYEFHHKEKHFINVDLYRIQVRHEPNGRCQER
jgi:putative methylase